MEAALLVLGFLLLGGGALWAVRSRARSVADKRSRADKNAKSAMSDARAIQKSLDGRR